MLYEDIREKIKAGDLIACRHDKWGSFYDLQVQAVSHGTGETYTHVCVAWLAAGRVYVIESVKPTIRIMPLSNMLYEGFYWIPTETPMTKEEEEFLHSKVGLPEGRYSTFQAIMAQFNKLDIGADDFWECAEFTICARRLSGLDLGNKATPGAVVLKAQDLGFPVYHIEPQNKDN